MLVENFEVTIKNKFDCDARCGNRGVTVGLRECETGQPLAFYCGECSESQGLKIGEKAIITK